MTTRRLGLLVAAALTLVLGACGVTDTPVPAPPAPPEVEVHAFGKVLPP